MVRLFVATVLRRLGQIDAVLDLFLERPLPERAGVVRDILRLAVGQLLYLGTPPHASVDTAVTLVQERGHRALTGLVNAILRRTAREGAAIVASHDAGRLNTHLGRASCRERGWQ